MIYRWNIEKKIDGASDADNVTIEYQNRSSSRGI